MDKNSVYSDTLLRAYSSGLLKISWNTTGFSIGIDPKRKDAVPELREKDFIDYAFSIIKIVVDLAEEKELNGIPDCDLETARKIYEQESDLKDHLYIKRNSKINCFKLLESQIISYRNEEDPKKTDANSAIIKLVTEKDDEDVSWAFEISRRDLGELINNLAELKEKIDAV